jgi:hypothetical protein
MSAEYGTRDREAIVYYTIALAVHVDLAAREVRRVVELREEIHRAVDEPVVEPDLSPVTTSDRSTALLVAEERPWPAPWEFGY